MHDALADVQDSIAVVDLGNQQRGARVGACLVALDIAGSFNNVRHDYVWEILRSNGLANDFIAIIRSMYETASTTVGVNGQLTHPFRPRRAVRQGCPWSMLLLNIMMSPLVKALAARLAGVSIPDVNEPGREPHLSVSAYVDDLVAILNV